MRSGLSRGRLPLAGLLHGGRLSGNGARSRHRPGVSSWSSAGAREGDTAMRITLNILSAIWAAVLFVLEAIGTLIWWAICIVFWPITLTVIVLRWIVRSAVRAELEREA